MVEKQLDVCVLYLTIIFCINMFLLKSTATSKSLDGI